MTNDKDRPTHPRRPLVLSADEEHVVSAVLAAIRRIRHGSVQIVVQDSRVVQIDTLEKMRLNPGA